MAIENQNFKLRHFTLGKLWGAVSRTKDRPNSLCDLGYTKVFLLTVRVKHRPIPHPDYVCFRARGRVLIHKPRLY